MNCILFDPEKERKQLQPFTLTRPVSGIRIGILTIQEKWSHYLKHAHCSYFTQDYLQEKFPINLEPINYYINGSICPDSTLSNEIQALQN